MEKSIKRRMCRFDMLVGTFFIFFVIVCFVLLLWIGYASAATIVVNQTSPANTSGDFYCGTIKESLNMAENGDTIIVCPGIYKENIVVDTSVCIQSYGGASDTIVEAKDVNDVVITITANKVNLTGFTIRNSDADGIYLNDADDCNLSGNNIYSTRNGTHLLSSNNNIIRGNIVNSNNNDGIELYSSNNNSIIANNASNNLQGGIFLEESNNNIIWGNRANSNNLYDGINLYSSDSNYIMGNNASCNFYNGIVLASSNDNTIRDNIATSNKQSSGMELHGSWDNDILNNNISYNFETGIRLFDSDGNTIGGNIVKLNKQYGVYFHRSHDNTITKNIINLNSDEGIHLNGQRNSISHNIINSNIGHGIYLVDNDEIEVSEKNKIVNNIVNSNYKAGLVVVDSKKNVILNNIIYLNGAGGIALINSDLAAITGNTISSNYLSGISTNRNGIIYHNNIINDEIKDSSLYTLWYHISLKEGNYWSDYYGTDNGSGRGKHAICGDGIGDTNLPHYYDNYPFMNKSGWLTLLVSPEYLDFGTVYQGEIVQKTFKIQNAFVYNKGRDDLNIQSIALDLDIGISNLEIPVKIQKWSLKTFNVAIDTTNLKGNVLRSIEIKSDDKITPNKTILIYGFVKPPSHDVRIRNIDYQSRVIKGQINLFNVTIKNTGDFREKNVSIEFKAGDRRLGNTTITNIESKENKSAIFKWDTTDVAPKTYDILVEVKLKDKLLSLATLQVPVKVDMPSVAQTLILSNRERLATFWSPERAEQLENELIKLSYHVSVAGIPVYVEEYEAVASAYESWDLNLQDLQIANNVSKRIKELIDATRENYIGIKYIIIVGDDRIIPFYRVLDNTDKPFVSGSWTTTRDYDKLNAESTVGSALHHNMFLTDNYYATDKPIEWKTNEVIIPELLIPSMPIGRLVESPEEITAVIDAFFQSETVNPDNVFVTAYDFMCDSALNCSLTLEDKTEGATETVISGKEEVTDESFFNRIWEGLNSSNDVVLIFQHAEHDRFEIPNPREIEAYAYITSQNISTATGLSGSITCSMGCFSGLNVPPNASPEDFDLAQAFAQRGVLAYIAPTSYSIGLFRSIGAHERLICYFTQYLCERMDVGTALTRAKQEYWATNYDISYIDEQVLETTTLYGLPMTRINVPRLNRSYNQSKMKIMSLEHTLDEKPDILVISPTHTQINIPLPLYNLTYYKSTSGELLSDPNRPLQPKEIRIFHPTSTRMLHGVVLTSAKYQVKSIIPLVDTYMQSHTKGVFSADEIRDWYPPQIFKLKSLCSPRVPTESRQYLIVITGQYKGSTVATPILEGRKERLYDELSFQLYYASPDAETKPPVINVSHRNNHNVTISANASDESGIQRVLVTYTDGEGEWKSKDMNKTGELWTCEIPIDELAEFFVQAVDNNGNVAVGNVFF